MSNLSSLKSTLSKRVIRDRLTLEERARLLWDITTDLDWDTYEKEDDQGNYLGANIDLAMSDLKSYDEEAIKNGW